MFNLTKFQADDNPSRPICCWNVGQGNNSIFKQSRMIYGDHHKSDIHGDRVHSRCALHTSLSFGLLTQLGRNFASKAKWHLSTKQNTKPMSLFYGT
jgi:hypothetical protein